MRWRSGWCASAGISAEVPRRAISGARASDKEFASVEQAQVAVKLMPLLSKQVIVDGVELRGLRASLVRAKDGKTNVDDLAGGGAPPTKEQPAGPAPARWRVCAGVGRRE